MSDPNFVILYVKSPTDSVAFYADLLGKAPVETSPTFAMFALDLGTMLGLWAAHTVGTTLQSLLMSTDSSLNHHRPQTPPKSDCVRSPPARGFSGSSAC